MVLMYDTSSNCALQLYEVLQSWLEIALQWSKGNNSKKICKAELWFLHMTHRLIETVRRMDRRKGKSNMSPNPKVGRYNYPALKLKV